MEGHYFIEKREHDWLIYVNGLPLLYCKSRKWAERTVRAALMQFSERRDDDGILEVYSTLQLPRHTIDVST